MTQLFCVFVIGFTGGTWCSDHPEAYPIGICHPVGDGITHCTATVWDFAAVASYYDPAQGNINCFHDPITGEDTCDTLGDGTPTATAYDWAMACPEGMLGTKIRFEYVYKDYVTDIGTWQCRDHGGAIRPTFGLRWTGSEYKYLWYIPYDLLMERPEPWTFGVVQIAELVPPKD